MTFQELRKRKYRTAQELADKLGVPMQRVSKWETGDSAPKIRDLRSVAKALGVSINTLIECFEEQGA